MTGDTVVGDTVVGDTVVLRSSVAGLLSLAAAEELILLAATAYRAAGEEGGPDRWAAVPLVAHNNHFKRQQAERLAALAAGQVPATYADTDHSSAEVYRRYAAQPAAVVMEECRQVSAELTDRMWALTDEDLLDPALTGRLLWLQVVVRGFWHATGHLGEYYLTHGQAERAVALQANALGTARYLDAPAAAAGMAGYNLACAQARAGLREEAARTLADAVQANPELRANAGRDPDLAAL